MNASALEKLCMGLPGATVDIKWGHDRCFLVGKKMFCVTGMDGPYSVSFKTPPEEFGILIERNGIIPAPYSARYHWVMVEDPNALRPAEWRRLIEQSYELVKGKLPSKIRDNL